MPPVFRVFLFLSGTALAALFCSHLQAGDNLAKSHTGQFRDNAHPLLLISGDQQRRTARPIWCPDNYRPKCPPVICPPTYCGRCDYYDAKCPPCVCPPRHCGTCVCYDAKCPPCFRLPCCFPDFFKCPPTACFVSPTVTPDSVK